MQRLNDLEIDAGALQDWIVAQQDAVICGILAKLDFVGRLSSEPDIVALTVPVENALTELQYQLARIGLDIGNPWDHLTADALKRLLRRNDIHVLPNVDSLVELRDKLTNGSFTRRKRVALEGEQELLAGLLEISPGKIRFDHRFDKIGIVGKTGFAHREADGSIFLYLQGRSKRHWSAILADMAFCTLTKDNCPYGRFDGEFRLPRNPAATEAETLRKRLGLKKSNQSRSKASIKQAVCAPNEGS